jgi:hypothetical protein
MTHNQIDVEEDFVEPFLKMMRTENIETEAFEEMDHPL